MANNPFDPPIVQVKKLLDRNGMGTVNHGFGSRRTVAPTSRPAPAPELPPEGVKNLSELGDVDTTGVTTGDRLTFDGTSWVPGADGGVDSGLLDAKGDLIVASAADTPARLSVGTSGQVLTVDPTTTTGLKWATVSGGGGSGGPNGAMLYLAAVSLASASGTRTVLPDTQELMPSGFSYNATTGELTCDEAGWYSLMGHVRLTALVSTTHALSILADGAPSVRGEQSSTSTIETAVAGVDYLAAGTKLTLSYFSGSAVSIAGGLRSYTTLRVVRM